jgi:hypothetical protein
MIQTRLGTRSNPGDENESTAKQPVGWQASLSIGYQWQRGTVVPIAEMVGKR